jgi:hypothetical protein
MIPVSCRSGYARKGWDRCAIQPRVEEETLNIVEMPTKPEDLDAHMPCK